MPRGVDFFQSHCFVQTIDIPAIFIATPSGIPRGGENTGTKTYRIGLLYQNGDFSGVYDDDDDDDEYDDDDDDDDDDYDDDDDDDVDDDDDDDTNNMKVFSGAP